MEKGIEEARANYRALEVSFPLFFVVIVVRIALNRI